MKRYLFLALVILFVLIGSSGGDNKKVYPYRWVRVGSGLRSDKDVEKIRQIAQTASQHGLNGILLSSGLDTMDLQPSEFYQRLQKVKELGASFGLEIIPSFMSVGYGGAVLAHDKNLAAGLPVKDALFIVENSEARLTADPPVRLVNGGFEKSSQDGLDGFLLSGKLGQFVSVDTNTFKEGKASLRFDNFRNAPDETVNIDQDVQVHPYRHYRLSCWVKAENLKPSDPFGDSNFQLKVLGGDEQRPLQYENPKLSPTDDWHKVTVGFNTWNYDKVRIMPSVSGGGNGKFWIDDLNLDEVGLINVHRRPGTPITVRGESSGMTYQEGRDFVKVLDPIMNFRYDHEGPPIEIVAGSRIPEGERLRVSFYHGTFIYNDQTPICMSEPKLYEIWRRSGQAVPAKPARDGI